MSRLLRDIPVERQIAQHMQWFERKREQGQRQVQSTRPSVPPQLGPYLSISRELASGGNELAQSLAEKLGWPIFDREIIEAIAEKSHVREELVALFDEHVRSAFDTYLQNLYTGRIFDSSKYYYNLSQVLLGIVRYGHAVILGRGANFILPAESGLRVRVVAPLEMRMKKLMREENLSEKHALQQLLAHDHEQEAFFQHYFHSKPDDPRAYDIVVNSGTVSLEYASTILLQLLAAKSPKP